MNFERGGNTLERIGIGKSELPIKIMRVFFVNRTKAINDNGEIYDQITEEAMGFKDGKRILEGISSNRLSDDWYNRYAVGVVTIESGGFKKYVPVHLYELRGSYVLYEGEKYRIP